MSTDRMNEDRMSTDRMKRYEVKEKLAIGVSDREAHQPIELEAGSTLEFDEETGVACIRGEWYELPRLRSAILAGWLEPIKSKEGDHNE